MVDATLVSQLLVAVAGAAVYAVVFFAKNSATDFDSFDWVKFGATLLVGAAIGGANFVFGGVLPTQESLESALVLYAGATAIVENVFKAIWRRINPPAPTP
jgi:hypothetical protein